MNRLISFLSDNSISFRENEPMKNHTSFRIGGNARIFVEAKSCEQLCLVLKECKKLSLPYFIIGNGSNLLMDDGEIELVIIHLSGEFSEISLIDETTIKAGAGATLASLCKFALENSLKGLEFAFGIPGTIGGAVFMNAGAYGGEMKDVVYSVEHLNESYERASLCGNKLSFGYRKSAYSSNEYAITSVIFKLQKGDKGEIEAQMNELLGKRKSKQPLEYPSAGSTFKRPEGYFAGALIEQSGLKGYSIGGAQVSEKHAGFIINKGDATCEDVKKLIEHCRKTVLQKFGVILEPEIKMIQR